MTRAEFIDRWLPVDRDLDDRRQFKRDLKALIVHERNHFVSVMTTATFNLEQIACELTAACKSAEKFPREVSSNG